MILDIMQSVALEYSNKLAKPRMIVEGLEELQQRLSNEEIP